MPLVKYTPFAEFGRHLTARRVAPWLAAIGLTLQEFLAAMYRCTACSHGSELGLQRINDAQLGVMVALLCVGDSSHQAGSTKPELPLELRLSFPDIGRLVSFTAAMFSGRSG